VSHFNVAVGPDTRNDSYMIEIEQHRRPDAWQTAGDGPRDGVAGTRVINARFIHTVAPGHGIPQ
jgi:hypothetical protein